ncbi:hypothetical protein ABCS02_11255 [Microbacterium sp. X-17]|uniref:hypothetical protein n=1 Tax=Microbacterium sp. X-17 TaxID=3144404 RepID=UPI0031F5CBE3
MPLLHISYAPAVLSAEDLRDALAPLAHTAAAQLGLRDTDVAVEVRPPSELTLNQRDVALVFDCSPDPEGRRTKEQLHALAEALLATISEHLRARGLPVDAGVFARMPGVGTYVAHAATEASE